MDKFLQAAGCLACCPTNSVNVLMAELFHKPHMHTHICSFTNLQVQLIQVKPSSYEIAAAAFFTTRQMPFLSAY